MPSRFDERHCCEHFRTVRVFGGFSLLRTKCRLTDPTKLRPGGLLESIADKVTIRRQVTNRGRACYARLIGFRGVVAFKCQPFGAREG
jgi:hypothetical protein